MQNSARPIGGESKLIQIFPLGVATELIRTPTPLFKTRYNFLLIFSRGGGVQQVDNEIFELATNDVLFIREGHLNAIKAIDPATEGYFIYIDNELLPDIFTDKGILNQFSFYPKHSVSDAIMRWLITCCTLMVAPSDTQAHTEHIQCALMHALIMKIANFSSETRSQPDRQSEITMLFKELVYENAISHRDVGYYADQLSITQNYLTRCVKQVTNKSPKQHLNDMAVHYGKALLLDQSKTVSEIAFALNFSEPAYFSRLFKQITGQSPSAYRESVLHDLSN